MKYKQIVFDADGTLFHTTEAVRLLKSLRADHISLGAVTLKKRLESSLSSCFDTVLCAEDMTSYEQESGPLLRYLEHTESAKYLCCAG